ncbi:MAG: hypothetical protein R2759_02085 [Bacteroidales bacterium]
MGFTKLTLQIPTDYSEQTLRKVIMKKLRIVNFTFRIESKSLDARNKRKIHWVLNVAVHSEELKGTDEVQKQQLEIPYKKRNKKVMIVGSGPAGIFAAIVLQKQVLKPHSSKGVLMLAFVKRASVILSRVEHSQRKTIMPLVKAGQVHFRMANSLHVQNIFRWKGNLSSINTSKQALRPK